MSKLLHLNITISGRVQGVGFRYNTKIQAQKFNLTGFVQNLENSTVYIEVEGEKEKLSRFLDWCKTGPKFSKVEKVISKKNKIQNFSDFKIL